MNNEAFERAKSAYGTGAYDDATMEFIFPQLRDSEDESHDEEPRFPQYDNIVDKVFGAGNLEGFEYREAEMLVALAKEELLKSLQQEQTPTEREIAEAHRYAEMIRERDKARIQQEQPEVDLEKFTEKMDTWKARYNYPDNIPIKATMAFTARMFYQYPNVARQWYDSLPKATMD